MGNLWEACPNKVRDLSYTGGLHFTPDSDTDSNLHSEPNGYAENLHSAQTQIQITASHFCIVQESESEPVSVCDSSHDHSENCYGDAFLCLVLNDSTKIRLLSLLTHYKLKRKRKVS